MISVSGMVSCRLCQGALREFFRPGSIALVVRDDGLNRPKTICVDWKRERGVLPVELIQHAQDFIIKIGQAFVGDKPRETEPGARPNARMFSFRLQRGA